MEALPRLVLIVVLSTGNWAVIWAPLNVLSFAVWGERVTERLSFEEML